MIFAMLTFIFEKGTMMELGYVLREDQLLSRDLSTNSALASVRFGSTQLQ
jgi:hypothetical protein